MPIVFFPLKISRNGSWISYPSKSPPLTCSVSYRLYPFRTFFGILVFSFSMTVSVSPSFSRVRKQKSHFSPNFSGGNSLLEGNPQQLGTELPGLSSKAKDPMIFRSLLLLPIDSFFIKGEPFQKSQKDCFL